MRIDLLTARWGAVVVLLALSAVWPPVAVSATGGERLKAFFNDVHSVRAHFNQRVLDPRQRVVQESSGVMMLQRPGRFRWVYSAPYKQLIVADGRRVWLYDEDLEQVTVKVIDEVIGTTPALLLSGDEAWERRFELTELGVAEGVARVALVPQIKDGGFERMVIGFGDEGLREMTLTDSLGQTTILTFSQAEYNAALDPILFIFVPPIGVDVVGEP